jgi:GGDEF domain-containing protein
LIRGVGRGLARATLPQEFAARMFTAGDEFAVLLPGVTEEEVYARALQIEKELDELTVPETHRALYQGASVGSVSRHPRESPGQALGRAIEVMRTRKLVRREGRS